MQCIILVYPSNLKTDKRNLGIVQSSRFIHWLHESHPDQQANIYP